MKRALHLHRMSFIMQVVCIYIKHLSSSSTSLLLMIIKATTTTTTKMKDAYFEQVLQCL